MERSREVIPIRPPMPAREEFDQIVQAANAGDRKALRKLRRLLSDCPEIWKSLGDLSVIAGNSFLRLASNGNHLISASISQYVREVRQQLLGPAPTPLERLAVERVVLAWAQANYVDAVVGSLQNVSQGTLNHWLKRQAQASRQFDASIKSLATLRRLLPAAERKPAKSRRRA